MAIREDKFNNNSVLRKSPYNVEVTLVSVSENWGIENASGYLTYSWKQNLTLSRKGTKLSFKPELDDANEVQFSLSIF